MSRHLGLVLLLLASSLVTVSLAGLLPNGDFETPPNPSALSGTQVIGKHAIPSWEASGLVEYIKSGQKQGDMVLVVPQGQYAVRLGNGGSIKQTVKNLVKKRFYAMTFSYGRTCAQEEKLNFSISPNFNADDSALLSLQTIYNGAGFDSYSWGFRAEEEEITIIIHHPSDHDENHEDPACGPLIDTVAINKLRPPRASNMNVVKNGGFEEGPYIYRSSSWGVLIPPNIEDHHSPLPSWIIESLKSVNYIDSRHYSVPEGKRAIELIGGRESAIAQKLRTRHGKTYVLTFKIGDAGNKCLGQMKVEACAGSAAKVTVPYNSQGTGGSISGKLVFKAVGRSTRIRFLSQTYTMNMEGSMCGPVIDDVKVISVRTYPHKGH